MISGFDQPTGVEYHDRVRADNGGQTMGDDDHRAFLDQRRDGLMNGQLAFGIQRSGRFVEDHDRGVFENGAGDADALTFAAGQPPADVADAGLSAVGQTTDEFMAIGQQA